LSEVSTHFDVRDLITGSVKHNGVLQANYDTVNRMAVLCGEIRFKDFYTQPFAQLVPRMTVNIEVAAERGLITDPKGARAIFDQLRASLPEMSFRSLADLVKLEGYTMPVEYRQAHHPLWQIHGVELPQLYGVLVRDGKAAKSIYEMIEHAGIVSYRTMYLTPRTKESRPLTEALYRAAKNNVVYLPPGNGLCCACGTNNCTCTVGLPHDFCAMSGGTCTALSTYCADAIEKL